MTEGGLAAIGRPMNRKFCYAGNWAVRMPDNDVLYLNTEEGADTILGLWEYIESLEARLKRRSNRRRKRSAEPAMEAEYEENIRAV